ncbi:hypothetical protein [Lacticaseibacillus sp. GG6-2]
MDTLKLQAFIQAHQALIADFHDSALAFQREKNAQRPLAQQHDAKRLRREVLAMVAAFVATVYSQEQAGPTAPANPSYHSWLSVIEQTKSFDRLSSGVGE